MKVQVLSPAPKNKVSTGYLIFCFDDGKGLEGRVVNDLPVASQSAPPPVRRRASPFTVYSFDRRRPSGGCAPARIKSFHPHQKTRYPLGYLVFCFDDGKGLEGRVVNDLPVASQSAPPPVRRRASPHHPLFACGGIFGCTCICRGGYDCGGGRLLCPGALRCFLREDGKRQRRHQHGKCKQNAERRMLLLCEYSILFSL